MAYKCKECGYVFGEDETKTYSENVGDFWGVPAYEDYSVCPMCGGDFEESTPCEICGEEHLNRELFGGACNNCINAHRKDFDTCYNISVGETEEVKINALLSSLFEPADIEQILKEYIKTRVPEINCSSFIDNDMDWFGEMLVKEVKKNEH